MRESFIFYRSFYEAISLLGEKAQLKLYKSIMKLNYNQCENMTELIQLCDEIETTLKQSRSTFAQWLLIKPLLLSNLQRYENGCKGGSRQGVSNNPNGRGAKCKKNYQRTTEELPHPDNILNTDDNMYNDNMYNGNINNDNIKKEIEKEKSVGDNPSLDELKAYFAFNSHGGEEAERFWNYYESIGWMINGNPIVNWKLVAVRWLKDSRNVPCAIKQAKKKNEEKRVQISDTEDTYDYFGIEKRCPHNAPPRPDFEYGWYGGKWMTNAHYHGDF